MAASVNQNIYFIVRERTVLVRSIMSYRCKQLPQFADSSKGYHHGFVYKDCLYIIGGVRAMLENDKQKTFPQHKQYICDKFINVYDIVNQCWSTVTTTGEGYGEAIENAGCVALDSKLYLFGGWNGKIHRNSMWCLDLENFKWEIIQYMQDSKIPSPRAGHSLTSINDIEILVFGGQGPLQSEQNELKLEITSKSSKYQNDIYNNQLLTFDVHLCKWTLLQCNGFIPCPRAYHSCTRYKDCFYIYGGRCIETGSLNDLWCYDIMIRTWTNIKSNVTFPSLYRHTANIVHDSTLIVIGGWQQSGVLNEHHGFTYNIQTQSVSNNNLGFQPRAGHTVCNIVGHNSLLIVGGEVNKNGKRVLTKDVFMIESL